MIQTKPHEVHWMEETQDIVSSIKMHEGLGIKQDNGLNIAFKYDGGKPRMDLIDPAFAEDLAAVLTMGSDKYDETKRVCDNNWRQGGMRWGQVYASLQRHLHAFWRGEDTDQESGLSHLAHAAANVMFLHYYSRRALHLDDRDHAWRRPLRIGLDVDGVLADWSGAIYDACVGFDQSFTTSYDRGNPIWWNWVDREFLNMVLSDLDYPEFLASVPDALADPEELKFEPVVYVTHRSIPSEYTERWISDNGFALAPVVSVDDPAKKLDVLREHNVDVFVEDKYETFVALNNAGILCFLRDRAVNRKYDVGSYRITNLNQIVERMR